MERPMGQVHKDDTTATALPEIMTFEEFESQPHSYPYVFELESGGKSLLYFGSRHVNNPEDPMFKDIETRFKQFQPDYVFVEGRGSDLRERGDATVQWLRGLSRDDAIRTGGEANLALKLAIESGAEIESPEPEMRDEIKSIEEQGYEKDAIFAYYLFRMVEQYHRSGAQRPLAVYLKPYMDEFQKATGWENFDYSVENLAKVGSKFWGELGSFDVQSPQRVSPLHNETGRVSWTAVNEVCRASGTFRDKHIVERIQAALKRTNKVMVVYGGTHAYFQEPALQKIFEERRFN